MRRQFVRVAFAAVVTFVTCGASAAPFVNLDFEQATVVPVGIDFIQAAPAFPGWTPRIDSSTLSNVAYNYVGFGEPLVSLFDVPAPGIGLPLLQGQYMAALVSRGGGFTTRASLTQTGDIPADALTLRMLADLQLGPPLVRINGIVIPMVLLTPQLFEGSLYAGDVSAFAGSTVELQFQSPLPPLGRIAGFDDIRFSSVPIPEPANVVGTVAAGISLTRRRRAIRSTKRPCSRAKPTCRC
jgi:hypothetical protein